MKVTEAFVLEDMEVSQELKEFLEKEREKVTQGKKSFVMEVTEKLESLRKEREQSRQPSSEEVFDRFAETMLGSCAEIVQKDLSAEEHVTREQIQDIARNRLEWVKRRLLDIEKALKEVQSRAARSAASGQAYIGQG